MIDWSKPIETWNSKPASVVWPDEADMKTVEIECGRWSYNMDGTPIGHSYGSLRNAENQQKHPPKVTFFGVDLGGGKDTSAEVEYRILPDGTREIIAIRSWRHDLELTAEGAHSRS